MYRRILITVLFILIGTFASFQAYSWAISLDAQRSSPAESVRDRTGETETITLTAAGDCLMHMPEVNSGLQADGSYRFDTFFADVAGLIQEGDYSSTNLETALAGPESGYTGYPMFNSPDEIANTFKQAGFDMVVTANNHSLDRGYSGGIRTLRVLREARLDTLGTYRDPTEAQSFLIKDIRGVKVGYLAYTYGTNGIPLPSKHPEYVNILQTNKILLDIKKLRPQVDVLILVLHWGVEYQPRPGQDQVALARDLLEAGADAILGSHPHVIQTMEVMQVKGKPKFVIYGMGNFISNQQELERKCGIVLKLKFKKDLDTNETRLIEVSYTPTFSHPYNDHGLVHYRVIPLEQTITKIKQGQDPFMDSNDLPVLEAALRSTVSQLGPEFKDE
ncbi:MAG: CapA family protein [Deltaproteobacteria bacterium]